jgi:hypothetical protein
MKLFEILEYNEHPTKSVLIECMIPYKMSLKTIFKRQFSDPLIMVTSVTNTSSYGKILNACDLIDGIYAFLEVPYIETDSESPYFDEDLFCEYETICANSISLDKL